MRTWTQHRTMVQLFTFIWKISCLPQHAICHHRWLSCYLSSQHYQNSLHSHFLPPWMSPALTISTVSAFIPFFLFHPISSYWLNNAPNIINSLRNFTVEIKIVIPDLLQVEEAKTLESNSEYLNVGCKIHRYHSSNHHDKTPTFSHHQDNTTHRK